MTWESVVDDLRNAGYNVHVNAEGGYVEVACGKGDVIISTKIPQDMITQCKYDMVKRVLMSQKSDVDVAILERGE